MEPKASKDDSDYDARALETFVAGGRILRIPLQHKKRLAILRWLVEDFQPGRLYAEKEVNGIIARRHPDFAALRRYLVDEEFMQRRRGVYWRAACPTLVTIRRPGRASRRGCYPLLPPVVFAAWRYARTCQQCFDSF